ncbi:MAG: HAD family hydrolase [Oscillospiraceae bacterium]
MKQDYGLSSFQPSYQFLVCIDSDGCAFDTMEIKHKECFCPATIYGWGLQAVSKYAREVWEYTNLYSGTRGLNRFSTLLSTLQLLEEREEVKEYGADFTFPSYGSLAAWVQSGSPKTNQWLQEHQDDSTLARTLQWSLQCNERIAQMVHGIPPFPGVRECLAEISRFADIAVVSATSHSALMKEWAEHDLLKYSKVVCGQETGSKQECIARLLAHYAPQNIIMVGDSLGDLAAANANGTLFYPIRLNDEIRSWREFRTVAQSSFPQGSYKEKEEGAYIQAFKQLLPNTPPWL